MPSQRAIIMSLLSVSSIVPKEYILDNRINKGYKIPLYDIRKSSAIKMLYIGHTQEDKKKGRDISFCFSIFFIHITHNEKKFPH